MADNIFDDAPLVPSRLGLGDGLAVRTCLPPVEWKALAEGSDISIDVTAPSVRRVERDDGYYWILDFDGWTVGKWERDHWSGVIGSHSDERYFDADFDQIGAMILPPDAP